MSDECNGWHNYETWVVNLWMDNERGQQDYWLEEARQCFDAAEADAFLTRSEKAASDLADRIKDEHEDAATEMLRQANYETGPLSDLLNGALGAVNWDQIARSWVEKMGEQAAYEKEDC
jgi:hypothetical protein